MFVTRVRPLGKLLPLPFRSTTEKVSYRARFVCPPFKSNFPETVRRRCKCNDRSIVSPKPGVFSPRTDEVISFGARLPVNGNLASTGEGSVVPLWKGRKRRVKRGEERFRRTYVRWPDVLRAKIESVVSRRDIVIETLKQISAVKKKRKRRIWSSFLQQKKHLQKREEERGRRGARTRQRECRTSRSQRVGTCTSFGHAKMVGRWILKISRAQKKLVHLISGASF